MTPPLQGEGDRSLKARGGGGSPRILRPEVSLARRQRRQMPLPEVMLWERLRRDALGARFRRQHPMGPYIADFYCAAHRLIVEVDGEAHNRGDQPSRDTRRDRFFEGNGYRVIRLTAGAILRDVDAVITFIVTHMARPLHHSPAASGPPPRAGEEWLHDAAAAYRVREE